MIYQLTEDAATNHPFIKSGHSLFYRFLFESLTGLSYDSDCKDMDCTKINIAQNIQDLWYEIAKSDGINAADLTMSLAMCGPKVNTCLNDYQIEVLPKAIRFTQERDFSFFIPEMGNVVTAGITIVPEPEIQIPKKQTSYQTKLLLVADRKFVKEIFYPPLDEFTALELPNREDCEPDVFCDIMKKNLLGPFEDAYDFGHYSLEKARIPKYTPEEDGKRDFYTMKEIAAHYETLFGCGVKIVKLYEEHIVLRKEEVIG